MPRTYLVAILSGVGLLVLVLELVRRRRLREEYSWVWLLTAVGYFLVAAWPDLSVWVSRLIGSANPASTFTFLGLLFLFLLSIQFSVQVSRLTEQNKDLAQQIAILDSELRQLAQDRQRDGQEVQAEGILVPDPDGEECIDDDQRADH